jgi:hypothetical protein
MAELLEEYSKEELIEIIKDYRYGYKAEAYNFLREKLKETIDAFNNEKIDVKSDKGDKLFDNWIKFTKELKKMTDAIEEMASQLDPTIKAELRRREEQATEYSPEWLANQKTNGD